MGMSPAPTSSSSRLYSISPDFTSNQKLPPRFGSARKAINGKMPMLMVMMMMVVVEAKSANLRHSSECFGEVREG